MSYVIALVVNAAVGVLTPDAVDEEALALVVNADVGVLLVVLLVERLVEVLVVVDALAEVGQRLLLVHVRVVRARDLHLLCVASTANGSSVLTVLISSIINITYKLNIRELSGMGKTNTWQQPRSVSHVPALI